MTNSATISALACVTISMSPPAATVCFISVVQPPCSLSSKQDRPTCQPACHGISGVSADRTVEALEEAMVRHGQPDIFNTDQGSQFTSRAFTEVLLKAGIAISMDGQGAWRDNVFVERLWRSVKYEEIYLKAYDTVSEARASIGRYLAFYNGRRPHSSLDRQTPDQAYFTRLPQIAAA